MLSKSLSLNIDETSGASFRDGTCKSTFDDAPKSTTLAVGDVKGGDKLASTEVHGDCIERVSPCRVDCI